MVKLISLLRKRKHLKVQEDKRFIKRQKDIHQEEIHLKFDQTHSLEIKSLRNNHYILDNMN